MSADLSTGGRTVTIGDIELTGLADAVGMLGEFGELYPHTTPDDWEPYRALYPSLHASSQWRLPVMCHLVRTGTCMILVDLGVGPPGRWDWVPEREGGLPTALADLGVDPSDVDVVLLTHLHIDHVGWLADGGLCPRAHLVAHADALAFALEHSPHDWLRRELRDLAASERLTPVAADAELAPGVVVASLPGHYPGHLGLKLASDGASAFFIADAAVHPILLDRPDLQYVSDLDQHAAAATRQALVAELVDTDTLAISGHYPGSGAGRVVRGADRIVWEEL